MCKTSIREYDFPTDPSATGYCIFPAELEDDDCVLFHATPAENLSSILKHGFRIPDPEGKTGLPSVSFAKRSILALTHVMDPRTRRPGAYVVLAVRYKSLNQLGLTVNLSDVHDYRLEPQPEIIGVCTISATYEHR